MVEEVVVLMDRDFLLMFLEVVELTVWLLFHIILLLLPQELLNLFLYLTRPQLPLPVQLMLHPLTMFIIVGMPRLMGERSKFILKQF